MDSSDLPSTSAAPVTSPGFLLTSAKDTFLKLWDLSTRHCVQTVVAHRGEVWSLAIHPNTDTIFTGSAEGELKAWRIDREAMHRGLHENEDGDVGDFPVDLVNSAFYIPILSGREDDISSLESPAFISASCLSDIVSSNTGLFSCPIS